MGRLNSRQLSALGLVLGSPDGKQFALIATDANGIGEVYTIGVDGNNLSQVTNSIGAIGGLSWR
jgi:hypothetical protein